MPTTMQTEKTKEKSDLKTNCIRNNTRKIIVFLGPSLSLQEASIQLPEAIFMPPVRCGDILRVSRLQPDLIIIIDGYFENTPAVWHKEILYAMHRGIVVFGVSSMGALRASELAPFGMRSMGDVAKAYIDGHIQDDDEVALLHSEHEGQFQQNSMAMINIRMTLAKAYEQNIIDKTSHDTLIDSLKKTHYRERNLDKTITSLIKTDAYPRLTALSTWLKQYGMVNAKAQDAIQLLSYIATHDITANPVSYTFQASNLFRGLFRQIACRPFQNDYTWLPQIEKIALASRYLDDTYLLIRRLAYLLAACYQLALDKTDEQHKYHLTHMLTILKLDAYDLLLDDNAAAKLDCDTAHYQAFVSRIMTILNRLTNARYFNELIDTPESYLILAMKIYNAYHDIYLKVGQHDHETIISHFRRYEPKRYQLLNMIAITWWFINTKALQIGLRPSLHALQQFSDSFRKKHRLLSTEALQNWLQSHNLNSESYENLIVAMVNINYLAMQNQLDILLTTLHEDYHWWFEDALYLSGYYHDAKQLQADASSRENAIKVLSEKITDDEGWRALDFMQKP